MKAHQVIRAEIERKVERFFHNIQQLIEKINTENLSIYNAQPDYRLVVENIISISKEDFNHHRIEESLKAVFDSLSKTFRTGQPEKAAEYKAISEEINASFDKQIRSKVLQEQLKEMFEVVGADIREFKTYSRLFEDGNSTSDDQVGALDAQSDASAKVSHLGAAVTGGAADQKTQHEKNEVINSLFGKIQQELGKIQEQSLDISAATPKYKQIIEDITDMSQIDPNHFHIAKTWKTVLGTMSLTFNLEEPEKAEFYRNLADELPDFHPYDHFSKDQQEKFKNVFKDFEVDITEFHFKSPLNLDTASGVADQMNILSIILNQAVWQARENATYRIHREIDFTKALEKILQNPSEKSMLEILPPRAQKAITKALETFVINEADFAERLLRHATCIDWIKDHLKASTSAHITQAIHDPEILETLEAQTPYGVAGEVPPLHADHAPN